MVKQTISRTVAVSDIILAHRTVGNAKGEDALTEEGILLAEATDPSDGNEDTADEDGNPSVEDNNTSSVDDENNSDEDSDTSVGEEGDSLTAGSTVSTESPSSHSILPAVGIVLGLIFAVLAFRLWIQSKRKSSAAKRKKKTSEKRKKDSTGEKPAAKNTGQTIPVTSVPGRTSRPDISLTREDGTGRANTQQTLSLGNTAEMSETLTLELGKLHEQGARPDQQDCFSVSDPQGFDQYGILAVVADGMGGLTNGGRVSQCAVSAMMEGFYRLDGDPQSMLLTLVERAVAAVNAELGPAGLNQSGSTLVAGLAKNGNFYYVSVGDSRICLYRDGALLQLNRDHILRRELEIQAINREIRWEDAFTHPKAQGLTSFLGMGSLKYVDIPSQPLELRHGDRLILMSDGVYNALSTPEICSALEQSAQEAADALGARIAAKNFEQQDNYTAIILAF